MIEINLVPDVKQELLKAQKVRYFVISIAILIGIISAGIVVILALYVFGAQWIRDNVANDSITKEYKQLSSVEDLANTLTVQNQLTKLSAVHEDKKINSRVFDVLSTIIPPEPNSIAITKLSVNSEEGTISIEAQAANGYPALETFKKTIEATKITYTLDGETESRTLPLASNLSDGERSYGDDESGKKVLRFTMTFNYANELFARSSKNAVIVGPTKTNATDSYIGVPKSLFTTKASDSQEGN
jgi:hypothetical protein